MLTRQFRTNLNCGNCVAAVKPFLDAEPGIHHWEVDTSRPEKVLTVSGEDSSVAGVATAVAKGGFKVYEEFGASPAPSAETTASKATTYYPLLLILLYLLGLMAIGQYQAGKVDGMLAMNHFMAGFFLTFSFFKLLDLPGFAASYQTYDLIAKKWPVYGFIYPFIELALGIAYLTQWRPLVTNAATLTVMSVSSVGVVQSLLARRTIRCACLGSIFNLPMSYVTLVEDVLMAGMALVMLIMLGVSASVQV